LGRGVVGKGGGAHLDVGKDGAQEAQHHPAKGLELVPLEAVHLDDACCTARPGHERRHGELAEEHEGGRRHLVDRVLVDDLHRVCV